MTQHKEELGTEWAADLDRVLYDEEVEKAIQEVGGYPGQLGTSLDDTCLNPCRAKGLSQHGSTRQQGLRPNGIYKQAFSDGAGEVN